MTTATRVQRTYLTLVTLTTLSASLIWGINTLFLLDAGLNNLEAFAANAFFTAGMVLFEVPTGVVADTAGRRASYLLGTATLAASTLLYVLLWEIGAPFWAWAVVSALVGLGFTFFSGALQAWVVDALTATGFTGDMEAVFGRGQAVTGAAMLTGSVAGGFIAQQTSLAVPFVLRGVVLVAMFAVASRVMRDVGFTPPPVTGRPLAAMRRVASASIDHGWRVPAVKWLMVESLVTGGVAIYGFYALQPYLLELYGDPHAYLIAGLSAAIVAGSQMLGGALATRIRGLFRHRASALIALSGAGAVTIAGVALADTFWSVVALTVVWGLLFSATMPIRQAFINDMIPSQQRATILSFDSLMTSAGGVWGQPVLGRAADAWGYAPSYAVSAGIAALGLPFLVLSRRRTAPGESRARVTATPRRRAGSRRPCRRASGAAGRA